MEPLSVLTPEMRQEAEALRREWAENPRWKGVKRDYRPEDVVRLRPSVMVEHTLAKRGAEKLWRLLHERPYVHTFGAYTGAMAVQMVRAGLEAIYLSGWQVAADANLAWQTYPDQSLYPYNSVPQIVKRINNALMRADMIERSEGKVTRDWYVPIVADAEAGFGGALNVFELTKAMIEAGAAGIHYEDQLASEKKCGHLGGKVLVPTAQHIRTLQAARLAADVMGVPTVIIARTDAEAATLITSDIDERDRPFIVPGERTPEGFYRVRNGIEAGIARALAYAPYADVLWMETCKPDLEEARKFAEAVKREFPGKLLAYNLLALLQLEEVPGRRDHRQVPAGAGGDGLQVPVHHPGGLAHPQLLHLGAGQGLQGPGHARLRGAPAEGVPGPGPGLHRR
jgi:isocitrate lyase